MGPARSQRWLIKLAVPCASSTRSQSGCRQTVFGATPEYLMELCRPVSSAAGRQSLRSASRGDLIISRFRLRTFGFKAFAISGPQLWNSLPLDVTQSRDKLIQIQNSFQNIFFNTDVKTFLFQQF